MAELRLSDTASAEVEAGVLVIPLVRTSEGTALADSHGLPRSAVAHLRGAIDALHLTGDVDEVTLVPGVPRVTAPLVALAGLGTRRPRVDLDPEQVRRGVGAALRRLAGREHVAVCLPAQDLAALRATTEGAALGAYAMATHRSRREPTPAVKQVTLLGAGGYAGAQRALRRAAVVGAAVGMCRDLVNDPPTGLSPQHFVDILRGETRGTRTSVTVLGQEDLAVGGFGGLVELGSRTAHGARLVTMSYRPSPAATMHLALVSKGITHRPRDLADTAAAGGPPMTSDMAGAAAVAAAVLAIAELGLPIEVTAHVALAEDVWWSAGHRLGEVIGLRGGTTVEIVDTDPVGRLALADVVAYASETAPDAVVDLATLTASQWSALGPRIAAVLGNDDTLVGALVAAARKAGEPAWRLPIPDDAPASLRSAVADLRSTGPVHGGILDAAGFLREFVGIGRAGAPIPWAHLDILGPALNRDDAYGYTPKGGTGFGVQTLVALAEDMASGSARPQG